MTHDDDASPARGRRADRGRRSAGMPLRIPRLPRMPRIALPALPRRGPRDGSTPAGSPPAGSGVGSAREQAAAARAARREEPVPGPEWVPRWIRRIPRRVLVVTFVAMLLGALLAGVLVTFGLGLIFVTDSCDVDVYVCNDTLFTLGYGMSIAGPLMLTSVAILVALTRMIRGGSRPWLVMVLGLAGSLAVYILGVVLVLVAVPGSSPIT